VSQPTDQWPPSTLSSEAGPPQNGHGRISGSLVMAYMSQRDFEEAVKAAHRGKLIYVKEVNGKKGLAPFPQLGG